jgi:hypothetical protein
MEIGDWKSAADLNDICRNIRALGQNKTYGWTKTSPDMVKTGANPADCLWHA